MNPDQPRSITDRLAHERTVLANERTMLAHLRTGLVFIATGVAVAKLFPEYGVFTTVISFTLAFVGFLFLVGGGIFYPTRNRRIRALKRRLAHTDALIDDLIGEEAPSPSAAPESPPTANAPVARSG